MQVQRFFVSTSAAAALALGCFAAQPAAQARPDNATARCTDGTYSTVTARRDACEEDTKDAAKSTKSAAKNAGEASKDAAKDVGHKSKDVAKDVAKGTKGVAKDVGKGSKEIAKDVNGDVTRPSSAPADATGKCKDGTYSTDHTRAAACADHGGVADWYK
ncbi:MAG: DUF3761 domain-containing protein [Acidobacteria bacterium]|nr:DUF3761 domain-containing protein [Acidobacteriota bacterium]